MIEFVLLFALGFLAAAVLGLLVAPVIYRRIVRFAEDRLKATMPLSAQEVRAQKDAARAGYAAETAKAAQGQRMEREKTVALMLRNESLLQQSRKISGENADLAAQVADMNVEAADLRSAVRHLEGNIERLKATLSTVERDNQAKSGEIKLLTHQLDRVSEDLDSLRIDLATRNTEAENLKSRIAGLRDERESLRNEVKNHDTRHREMEARFGREQARIRQLESRLAKELSTSADKDSFLERRASEIERLKAKVRDTQGVSRPLKATRPDAAPRPEKTPKTDTAAISTAESVRSRASALGDRLIDSKTADDDEAMRTEMAEIAATMVAMTAAKEGEASPIPGLLEKAADGNGAKGTTLADRIGEKLRRPT